MSSGPPGFDRLSSRGHQFLKPPPRYLAKAFKAWNDRYDAESNKDGYLFLSIAENKLGAPLVSQKVEECRGHPPSVLQYDLMAGSDRFRKALAQFFSKFIFKSRVGPDNFIAMAGAGAILDMLATTLGEEGDYILTFAPLYRGFENDLEIRARCRLALAEGSEKDNFSVSKEVLDLGLRKAQEEGKTVKSVLLCSPMNPTGQVLTRQELINIVRWCRSHHLHCIVDEVYAMSVFDPDKSFTSVYEVLQEEGTSLGDDVHIVWSFSKDFCASGFRVGVCYTENQALLGALQQGSYFASCSTDTQASLTKLLQDSSWLSGYFEENQRRLREAYIDTVRFWESLGAKCIKSSSGFFVWINLMDLVKDDRSNGWDTESRIDSILEEGKVLLTRGKSCFCSEPGWFRCCFAALSKSERELAWSRMRAKFA